MSRELIESGLILLGIMLGLRLLWEWWLWADRKHFEKSERELDQAALDLYPTKEAVMKALVVEHACGCTERWDCSPPGGWACGIIHQTVISGPMPIQAWRARDVLRRKGEWK